MRSEIPSRAAISALRAPATSSRSTSVSRDESGEFSTNPSPDARLGGGQVLIAIGTPGELAALAELTDGPEG